MASLPTGSSHGGYDYSFKILLIGDSGVGKSSLLVSFISSQLENLAPTIGVDFKIKVLDVGGKKLKLTIWDTAGQERFRTLTGSYYRGAQGIILVYDVTRRETFTNLSDVWAKEIDLYSTNKDCIKMLVGNKVDKDSEREVTKEEGDAFAQESGCLFLECSAKTRSNVEKCFEELALKVLEVFTTVHSIPPTQIRQIDTRCRRMQLKLQSHARQQILEVPSLLEEGSSVVKRNILKQKQENNNTANGGPGCCS